MGFTVEEKVEVARFGLSLANCFVTVHCNATISKFGTPNRWSPMPMPPMPMPPMPGFTQATVELPHCVSYTYYMYASNAAGITALKSEEMSVCLADYPADLVAAAYVHLKAQRFAGMTLTQV